MSYPALNELTRAEQLFDEGKLDEALEILNDWSQFEGLNFQQKTYFQFLKGLILTYQNKTEEGIELGELMLKEGQRLNENLHSFDGLFFIIMGLGLENKFEEAFNRIGQAETSLGLISNVSKKVIIQREVRLSVLKAWLNSLTGNPDVAEKNLEEALQLQEELDITFETVWANILMAQIMILVKGR